MFLEQKKSACYKLFLKDHVTVLMLKIQLCFTGIYFILDNNSSF